MPEKEDIVSVKYMRLHLLNKKSGTNIINPVWTDIKSSERQFIISEIEKT